MRIPWKTEINCCSHRGDWKVYEYRHDASFEITRRLCWLLWIDYSKYFDWGCLSLLQEQLYSILASARLCLCRKWVVLHFSSNNSSRNYNEKQVFHRHQIESDSSGMNFYGWLPSEQRRFTQLIFLVLYQIVWNQPCLDLRFHCF